MFTQAHVQKCTEIPSFSVPHSHIRKISNPRLHDKSQQFTILSPKFESSIFLVPHLDSTFLHFQLKVTSSCHHAYRKFRITTPSRHHTENNDTGGLAVGLVALQVNVAGRFSPWDRQSQLQHLVTILSDIFEPQKGQVARHDLKLLYNFLDVQKYCSNVPLECTKVLLARIFLKKQAVHLNNFGPRITEIPENTLPFLATN